MNYFLIYCYQTNDYHLINKENLKDLDCELLFEFGESELRIAKKVFSNLKLERALRPNENTLFGLVA